MTLGLIIFFNAVSGNLNAALTSHGVTVSKCSIKYSAPIRRFVAYDASGKPELVQLPENVCAVDVVLSNATAGVIAGFALAIGKTAAGKAIVIGAPQGGFIEARGSTQEHVATTTISPRNNLEPPQPPDPNISPVSDFHCALYRVADSNGKVIWEDRAILDLLRAQEEERP